MYFHITDTIGQNYPFLGNSADILEVLQLQDENFKRTKISRQVHDGISTIISLIKSRTLVFGFVFMSLGTFLIASGLKIPDIFLMSRLLSSVYLAALATYLYNDLTDYKIDKLNNRKIVYESKKEQYNITLYSTIGFFATSLMLAFSINISTGIACFTFIGLGIVYSHPRTHYKDRFFLKTVITAAGGFIVSTMGFLAQENFTYLGIVSSVIVFSFWFILGPLGDVGDIRGDRQGGRRTMPIVIGMKKTFIMMICVASSIAMLILLTHNFLGVHTIGVLLGVSVCAFVIYKISNLSKQYENRNKLKQTRITLRYSIFGIQVALFLGSVLNTTLG